MQILRQIAVRIRPAAPDMISVLVLATLGSAVNLFPVTLGFGIHYLFGSIFAMVAALWRGPVMGMAVALVAGLPVLTLWIHPIDLGIVVAEVGLVGYLARRYNDNPVVIDLLFWLVLGGPLILGGNLFLLHAPFDATLVAVLKQAVNGLFNTSVGSLLVLWAGRWLSGGERRFPLHLYITRAVTPLVLLPVLVTTVATARQTQYRMRTELQDEVVSARQIAEATLGDWVRGHQRSVEYLARAVAPVREDPEAMSGLLSVVGHQQRGFLGLYVGDSQATVIAMTLLRPFPVAVGDNYSHRAYFRELLRTRRGGVSDVYRGLGVEEPVVAITEPIFSADGQMDGYVLGALAPDDGNRVLERLHTAFRLDLVVTDRAGQVVLSTRSDLQPLDPYQRIDTGSAQPMGDGVYMVIDPAHGDGATLVSERYLDDLGWTIHVTRPLGDVQSAIHGSHIGDLLRGLLTVAAVLLALRLILQGVTRPLALLASIRVADDGAMIQIPDVERSQVEEVQRLQAHLAGVAGRLAEANGRLAYQAAHDALTGVKNAGVFRADLDRQVEQGEPFTLMMLDVNGFKRFNDLHGHLAGDRFLREVAAQVAEVVSGAGGTLYRYGGDEFAALLPHADGATTAGLARSLISLDGPAVPDGPFRPSLSVGMAHYPAEGSTADELVERADLALYGEKRKTRAAARWFQRSIRLLEEPAADPDRLIRLESLLTYLCEKLPWLYEHAVRVARLSVQVGAELSLSAQQMRQLELGALLHDIGKVEVPRAVLAKEGALTEAEYLEVQRHAAWGADLVLEMLGDDEVAAVAGSHHERYDGNGYPQGIAGEAIPFLARIVGAADAYDAMTHQRPYAEGVVEEAKAELMALAGTQFDPEVVAVLVRVAV